jgi:integrase
MAKHALTEPRIDALKPRAKRYTLKESPGLELRVTPKGTKTFCCVYKTAGKQYRETIGQFPSVSLEKARQKVAEILGKKKVDAHSVAGLARRYLDAHPENADAERVFRLHILPRVGTTVATRLTRGDVLGLLDKLKPKGRTLARDAHKHLRAMYNWAIDYELVEANPAARISKKRRPELRDRDDDGRALSDDDLHAIWAATRKMGYPFGTLYQLVMLTGQRRADWSEARWREIKEGALVVPAKRFKVKTHGDHLVPLSRTVRAILRTLPRWTKGDYMFTTTDGAAPISGYSKAAKRCTKLSGVQTRLKDFRTTCRTRLVGPLGVREEIAERVLGHVQQRLVRIYDKHKYEKEKGDALHAYARHVRGVVR